MDKAGFVPAVHHGVLADYGISFKYVFLKASTADRLPSVLEKLSDNYKVVIDPETSKLRVSSNARSKSFNSLPFVDGCSDTTQLFGNSSYRLDNLVKPCVQFQKDNGSAEVVAPYFLTDDWRSNIFITNIELLVDSYTNLNNGGGNSMVACFINVSKSFLGDLEAINYIVSRYTEDHSSKVSTYIVGIDDLDDRDCDEATLIGLARLVHSLSEYKPVIVKPIGGFGEVLIALGASGFSSGIASAETFTLSRMSEDGYVPQRGDHWIYVPEIFNYMQENDLKTAGYTCSCQTCSNSLPTTREQKNKHYLSVKKQRAEELLRINGSQKVEAMKQKLNDAKSYARKIKGTYNVGPSSTAYLDKWLTVLEQGQLWSSQVASEVELDELLGLIDDDKT